MIEKPKQPEPRYWYDSCGWLKNKKHTSLICRFIGWLNKKYKKEI